MTRGPFRDMNMTIAGRKAEEEYSEDYCSSQREAREEGPRVPAIS